MKKKVIIGNLKMNLISPSEAERYVTLFQREISGKVFSGIEIVLCPPVVHLERFVAAFKDNLGVKIGVQNVFWEEKGSYTGEISPLMVKNYGGGYSIIGHSERRRYFGENNETINMRIRAALKSGLVPIFCIGETKEDRDRELTSKIIIEQLEKGLEGISGINAEKIIYVYEPVWSVDTDNVPTGNEIMSARLMIRKKLIEKFGEKTADRMRVAYGGSINTANVVKVCVEPGMDGGLVGRESLIPHDFIKITETIL